MDSKRMENGERRMENYFNSQFQNGQSLLEVIIAMAVGILVVSALVFATIFSLRNAAFAKNSAQATKLAQEGIERVRSGRDRNSSVTIGGVSVDSWSGTQPVWDYQIHASAGCDDSSTGGKCYFNVNSSGALTNIGFAFAPTAAVPLPSLTESVPLSNQVFRRMILLSDDGTYRTQKTVTVIVQWTDATGPHESKLTTILRRI